MNSSKTEKLQDKENRNSREDIEIEPGRKEADASLPVLKVS